MALIIYNLKSTLVELWRICCLNLSRHWDISSPRNLRSMMVSHFQTASKYEEGL